MRNNRGVAEIGVVFAILAALSLFGLLSQDGIKRDGKAKYEHYHTSGAERIHGQGMRDIR